MENASVVSGMRRPTPFISLTLWMPSFRVVAGAEKQRDLHDALMHQMDDNFK